MWCKCLIPLAAMALAMPVAAQTDPVQQAAAADALPTDAAAYLIKAGAADQFEIQSAQLALQASSGAAIKRVAGLLIADHTKTSQALMRAAEKAGITPPPPPPLDATQQAMMTELQGLQGAAFDATWLRQQGMAHELALELHQNYAKAGDTPALRKAAAASVAMVKRHMALLKEVGAPM